MDEIGHLLEQLKSPDRDQRYRAVTRLRKIPDLPPEARAALEAANSEADDKMTENAELALDSDSSGSSSPAAGPGAAAEIRSLQAIPYWKSRNKKLIGLAALGLAALAVTLPYSISPQLWLALPYGWCWYWPNVELPLCLVWLVYAGLVIGVMRINRKAAVLALYVLLAALVLLNAAGCQGVVRTYATDPFSAAASRWRQSACLRSFAYAR